MASDDLAALTAEDWRFLFLLGQETRHERSLASLFDIIADHAASEPHPGDGRRDGAATEARRLIARDMVERATRGDISTVWIPDDNFVTVREAASLHGVSRQAINHLVRDGKVGFVRRAGLVLIDRGRSAGSGATRENACPDVRN